MELHLVTRWTGRIFVIQTADGGKSWRVSEKGSLPSALKNEAGFAASGTCLATFGKRQVWIGLGGKAAENGNGFFLESRSQMTMALAGK